MIWIFIVSVLVFKYSHSQCFRRTSDSQRATFANAESKCQEVFGPDWHFASIHSDEEDSLVRAIYDPTPYPEYNDGALHVWIGYTGTEWTDGSCSEWIDSVLTNPIDYPCTIYSSSWSFANEYTCEYSRPVICRNSALCPAAGCNGNTCKELTPNAVEQCNGRNCYNIDIHPVAGVRTETRVVIASTETGSTSYFDVYFTASGGDCLDPEITFSFELIDYNAISEYLEIYDGNTLLATCQGGEQAACGQCFECLKDRDLRANIIPDGQTYKLTVKESAAVHAWTCNDLQYSTYAELRLLCQSSTADGAKNSPFIDPFGTGPHITPNEYPSSIFIEYKDTLNMILLVVVIVMLLYLVRANCAAKQKKGGYSKVVGFEADDVESEAEKNAYK